jgi:membrane-bound lytic murein transglycosylase D
MPGITTLLRCALLSFALLASPVFADSPFDPPKELEPDIQFWIRIYTQVGTDGGLVHDDRYLDVVYEEMKFPDSVSQAERGRRVSAAKQKYVNMLRAFAAGRTPVGEEEKRVRALWPAQANDRLLRQAADRVRFQLGQSDRFREGLVRAGAYEAHIAETLANRGLPRELAALPHVESSFNPNAYSHAGAAGLWQFMRSTGRRYMRIDGVVDERMDPYRATVAAAQLLEFNYQLLGTWPLAITAYNHGAAGMRRAKDRTGTDDIVAIVRNHTSRTFGFASRNYYIAFLAALEVDRNAEKYFGSLVRDTEEKTRSITIPAYVSIASVEKALGVNRSALRPLNPALTAAVWRGERYVPRDFDMRLPETMFADADPALKLASLAPAERFDAQKAELLHRVQAGETLSTIAARNGTTVSTLMRLNDLRSANSIRKGQVLRMPGAAPATAVAAATPPAATPTPATATAPPIQPATAPAPAPTAGSIYVVRRGDALSDVAKRVGLSEKELMALNRIENRNFIYEGQRLRILKAPGPAAPEPPPLPGEIVTVTVFADASAVEDEPVNQEKEIARTQEVEPVSEAQAEAIGPTLVPGAQSPASADPSDYTVAEDGSIEVQAAETLGHYAEWLNVRASDLRDLNHMKFGRPVVIGRRVKLDLSEVSAGVFEQRRRDFHQRLQEEFFAGNHIVGTEVHVVRPGESLWVIAQKYPNVPIWLLRQYNPDVDFGDVRPRTALQMPKVEPTGASGSAQDGAT